MGTYAVNNNFAVATFAYTAPMAGLGVLSRYSQVLALSPVLRETTFFKDPYTAVLAVIFHVTFDRQDLARRALG
jgi:hypothetical protein